MPSSQVYCEGLLSESRFRVRSASACRAAVYPGMVIIRKFQLRIISEMQQGW